MPPQLWKAKALALQVQLAKANAQVLQAAGAAKAAVKAALVKAKAKIGKAVAPPLRMRAKGGARGPKAAGAAAAVPPPAKGAGGGLGGLALALAAAGVPPPGGGAAPPGGPAAGKAAAKAKAAVAIAPPPGAMPGAGGAIAPMGLAFVHPPPAAAGNWVSLVNNPAALTQLALAEDSYLEIALADPVGGVWAASAVFAIRKLDPQDGAGQFALVDLVGASLPAYASSLEPAFPRLSPHLYGQLADSAAAQAPVAVLHLCTSSLATCTSVYGNLGVQHAELCRVRSAAGLTEQWLKAGLGGATAVVAQGPQTQGGLPAWLHLTPQSRAKAPGQPGQSSGIAAASDGTLSMQPFHSAPPRNYVADTASNTPGQLYADGMERVRTFMGQRGGATSSGGHAQGPPSLAAYVLLCVIPLLPENKRESPPVLEMKNLALSLDAIGHSEPNEKASEQKARTADILMQRFKAVELSMTEGWSAAKNLLLMPKRAYGLASDAESEAAMRTTLHEASYQKALQQMADH